ncbi:geranylgeranyl transferase type-2 subunit alpha [Trypanosoma grayi]|uniref:geranylgeranyl transferase type-2 subunit alpha n=1 Tax=Trypanosoma grayi TaxID=71804 RepID=UPI0004F44CEE|nr:geranylgeranyl transferase type-2 subunit alpha [Trypanosoma grayi]KEG10281.1 geranylgeranyl transferase type-2 subunit alpha [Trypanosoma grayi]
MHDQRKVKQEIDAKTRERHLVEVQEFTTLYDSLLEQRKQSVYTEKVLHQLTNLLRKNPEAYTMYNYRRCALLHIWSEARQQAEAAAATTTTTTTDNSTETTVKEQHPVRTELDWLKDELILSSSILLSDYKVYAAFVHRRWIFTQLRRLAEEALTASSTTITTTVSSSNKPNGVGRGACPEVVRFWESALLKEKRQCDALLMRDERNFHAWNYRRWALRELAQMKQLLAQFGVELEATPSRSNSVGKEETPSAEWQQQQRPGDLDSKPMLSSSLFTSEELRELRFTTMMVRRNFSNYSAWHQRGLVLKTALKRLEERPADDAVRVAALEEAWTRLEEDLVLVITAVYCDPADQSAWYYAQFLTRAAGTVQCMSPAPSTSRVDVTGRLVEACIELVAEEKRLGGEAEAYWPRLYLFTTLLSLFGKTNAKNTSSSGINCDGGSAAALIREVCEALGTSDLAASGDHYDAGNDKVRLLQELAAQFSRADPLRAGMHQCLLAAAVPPQ